MAQNLIAQGKFYNTIRFRLIIAIGLIILFFQCISIFWLWHESKEQIGFMVEAIIKNINTQKHINKEIHEAIASLAVPGLLMIIITLLLCYQAVKWIIHPLSELQTQLENRSEDDLNLLDCKESVLEIDSVTHAINHFIARLTSSLERERLFTADVAHELRTPLAGLRLHLELFEKQHNIEVRPLIKRLDQMTDSVSQLLQLARVSQAFSTGNYQRVSLANDVVLPVQQELLPVLASRGQQFSVQIEAEPDVEGDSTLMRALLRNLVENAHRYSPENSTITVTVTADARLIVEDEGPGIDVSKRHELSKAFTRMDSRYGGIGLGLSIVTRIAQIHNARFFLQNREDTGGCQALVMFNLAE